MKPIGHISSCFKEKFGIPRQPGLMREARATLTIQLEGAADAVREIEGFSHVWIIFQFHESQGWNPLVRPPRLGGARKVGVFASRSPHRPNAIGISAVALDRVETASANEAVLHLSGIDLLDGTPVLDVKPYIAYADSIPQATDGWAAGTGFGERPTLEVSFSAEAQASGERYARETGTDPLALIREMLALDPRPSFQRDGDVGQYANRVLDLDVHWEVEGASCRVLSLVDLRGPRR